VSSQPAQLQPSDFATLVAEAAPGLNRATPEEILGWAYKNFPRGRIALCTSLQATGMVLVDMAWRLNPQFQVFTIDSGRLPPATLELMDEVRERYHIRLEVLYPDSAEVSELVSEHGVNLFYRAPELRLACCEVRKVRPLQRRLRSLDAWITGLRREDSATRADADVVEVDEAHGGIVKLNPLAHWTDTEVWDYIKRNKVPTNALYKKGYSSIGCDPCTRPTEPGEGPRDGRWWWERGDKECGIQYEVQVTEEGETVATLKRTKN
jgi:thioredoxin-dependent adenylylsulfate APS reductase